MNPKTKLIRSLPLFSDASKRELEQVAALADEVQVPEGKALTCQGSTGKQFLVLAEGEAEVSRDGQLLATLGPGDFFGETALITHEPRNATVRTRTPSKLLVLSSQGFRSLLATNRRFELRVRAQA